MYRTSNPKFEQYKDYGGRGIKCLITKEELKFLWFRDKAFMLKKPSINRIDNDGHYTVDNCNYIERGENSRLRNQLRTHCKHGHEFTKQNTYIRKIEKYLGRGCRTCLKLSDHKIYLRTRTSKRKYQPRVYTAVMEKEMGK